MACFSWEVFEHLPRSRVDRRRFNVQKITHLCVFIDAAGGTLASHGVKTPAVVKSSFHVYHGGNVFEETCAVAPFRSDTLDGCAYNRSNGLVLIIHGWTVRPHSCLTHHHTNQVLGMGRFTQDCGIGLEVKDTFRKQPAKISQTETWKTARTS